jgi:hypothetical protein
MRNHKAQSGREFLLIFLVTVGIMVVLMLTAQRNMGGVSEMKAESDAQHSVDDLSAAAKEVYAQGTGAKKQVFINLPTAYEPFESFVADNAIKLRVKGSDYVSIEDFGVHGTLPGSSGTHWVWVISEGNTVRIGSAMITLSDSSVYLVMNKNSSESTFFFVESLWDESIIVTSSITWNGSEVTMNSSDTNFVLSSGDKKMITLDFLASLDSAGFYEGEISYTATDGTYNETLELPVLVEVMASTKAPPLTVVPSLWNETMLGGDSSRKMFTVCTNEETTLTGVQFVPSSSAPGSWVVGNDSLGPMASATCVNKVMNLTVPNGTPNNLYGGYIDAIGQGTSGARDIVTLSIQVGGPVTDTSGPLVTDFEHFPNKSYSFDPVIFRIMANDSSEGNSTIKSCELSPDFMDWLEMMPLDGVADSEVEYFEIEYPDGFSMGDHTLMFRCTDIRDNVGEEQNYTFKVMKNFLFASKTDNPKSHEKDWMSWVESHLSDAGYNWHFDTTDEDNLLGGLVDLEYYSVIAVADYQFSSTVPSIFQDYVNQGGIVLMLGQALQQGPRDQGLTTGTGTIGSHSSIYIIDGTHYITEDYSDGQNVTIFDGSGGSKAVGTDFTGTGIASVSAAQSKYMIAEDTGFVLWGPVRTGTLSGDGEDITVRVLDHALDESTIEP